MLQLLFWLSAALVVYTYLGYGLLVTLLARLIDRPVRRDGRLRSVTLLIAAYNEREVIADKLRNALALDYPRDLLEVVVVADGSDDGTPEVVAGFAEAGVRCLYAPPRRGKMAALKRAVPLTRGELIVFSDANTFYNRDALRRLVAPFADPQVGCVAGEKRVQADPGAGGGSGEGLYWRYESYLKRMDSRVYSVTGAAGELYAVRRDVLELPPDDSLIDDFMVSMLIARRGYRVLYEPGALAVEAEPPGLRDEFERRARIGCGGFQSMWWLRGLLHPRHGLLWFQYVSHRVLRWAVAPLALPLLVLLNAGLAVRATRRLYRALLVLQLGFYLLAGAGLLAAGRGRRRRLLAVPGHFVLMNAATLVGLYRYLTHSQSVAWKKARRTARGDRSGQI